MDQLDGPITLRQGQDSSKMLKKWRLSPDEWEMLAKLCAVLKVSFVQGVCTGRTRDTGLEGGGSQ
jgi:hypothetical protein